MAQTIVITHVDVSTPAGKKYQVAETIFKMNGETKTKKIMSFANPAVFNTLKDAMSGEEYSITQEKDGNGYWQWTSITKGGSVSETATAAQAAPARKESSYTGRDFETKEERAERQRLIVRQSCLAQAVATLSAGVKSPPTVADVLSTAEQYVAWVTDAPDLFDTPNDLEV